MEEYAEDACLKCDERSVRSFRLRRQKDEQVSSVLTVSYGPQVTALAMVQSSRPAILSNPNTLRETKWTRSNPLKVGKGLTIRNVLWVAHTKRFGQETTGPVVSYTPGGAGEWIPKEREVDKRRESCEVVGASLCVWNYRSADDANLHCELVRIVFLVFLQAHRETYRFFTASGVDHAQHNQDLFRFRRAAFYSHLKSKASPRSQPYV